MLNTLNINLKTDIKTDRPTALGIKLMSQDKNNNQFILRFTNGGEPVTLDDTYTVEILTKFSNSGASRLTSAIVRQDYATWQFDTEYITQDETVYNYVYVRKAVSLVVSADANAFYFDVGLSEIDKDAGRVAEVYDKNYQKYLDEFKDNVDFEEIAQAEQARKEAELLREENYEQLIDTAIVEADVVAKVDSKVTELTPQITSLTAQLAQTVHKGEGGVITPTMLSQETKEQMTGGSVAVVGVNAVLEENIVDGAVSLKKLGGLDDVIIPKTLSQNTGEFTNHIVMINAALKGWALPFQKSKFGAKITKIRVGLSVDAAAEIELGIGDYYAPIFTQTKTLSESGFLEYDVNVDTSLLNDTFYIYFKNTTGNGLRLSKATQGDYPTLASYEFFYWTGSAWNGSTGFATFAIADIKIYSDYTLNYSINGHTHKFEDIDGFAVENKVKLSLPDKYDLVVGDKFELFYKGIILANDPYQYNIKVESTKGKAFRRKYEYQPVSGDVGTQAVTISLYDDDEVLIDTKTVNLIVRAKATSPATKKNVLLIGDSLISDGTFVNETFRRLTSIDGTPKGDGLTNINFVGTRKTALGAGYEGYGGWTYSNYTANTSTGNIVWANVSSHDKTVSDQHSIYADVNGNQWKIETIEATRIKLIKVITGTLPASGTLTWASGGENHGDIVYTSTENESGNPFWNETTGAVDFANYAVEQGISSIDVCYVLLGWNMTYLLEGSFKAEVRNFINLLRADFPNSKVVLMGVQVPSIDGFGTNYGATWNYYDKLKFVFNLNRWYKDISLEYTNVEFLNIAGQFDTEYNMPYNEYYVNTRSTTIERRSNNGVHPSNDGYMQIADAVYRNIVAQITT